jgi:hypothetical protein
MYHTLLYYGFLWQVLGFAGPFTSLSKLCKNVGPKPVCLAIPAPVISIHHIEDSVSLVT